MLLYACVCGLQEIWVHEALFRIKNKKELEGGGGGGGGCCTIS
jgi:hypothetical protein